MSEISVVSRAVNPPPTFQPRCVADDVRCSVAFLAPDVSLANQNAKSGSGMQETEFRAEPPDESRVRTPDATRRKHPTFAL